MSDFNDLLNKAIDTIDRNYYDEHQREYDLDCGHKVNGVTNTLLVSARKVGLNSLKSIHVCPPCAYVIYDKEHPDHKSVKSLVKKRASR